jgi:hypothetical protein
MIPRAFLRCSAQAIQSLSTQSGERRIENNEWIASSSYEAFIAEDVAGGEKVRTTNYTFHD